MIDYRCPECALIVDTKWYLNIAIHKCRYCESTDILFYLLPRSGIGFNYSKIAWGIGWYHDEDVEEDPLD